MNTGKTINLDGSNFNDVTVTENKLVMVDFWAHWCGPCRAVTPILDRLANEYSDNIIVGKVNVDEQKELAIKFGISSIPTIQIYKDGHMIDTIIGSQPYQNYKNIVDRYISM